MKKSQQQTQSMDWKSAPFKKYSGNLEMNAIHIYASGMEGSMHNGW